MHKYTWAIPVTVIAAICMSTTPVWFALLHADPLIKPFWRLEVTLLLMLPSYLYQFYQDKEECLRLFRGNVKYFTIISGTSIGLYYDSVSLSVMYTSVANSLIFQTTIPMILAGGALLLCIHITLMEILGVLVGFGGILVIAWSNSGPDDPNLLGDMLALLSAFFFSAYYAIGRYLREKHKVKVFTYSFSVNFIGLIVTFVGAVIHNPDNAKEVVSWVTDDNIYGVLGTGGVAGYGGHVLLNFILKYISPILVSVIDNLEPVYGSMIGWVLGVQGIPSWPIWVGGAVMIVGSTMVAVGGYEENKEKKEELLHEEEAPPEDLNPKPVII